MRKKVLAGLGLLFLLIGAACTDNAPNGQAAEDIKEMVYNYSVGSFEEETASITSDELIVIDKDDQTTTYELPEEEFFVSIAPYVEQTHPCAIHSLTGCQAELMVQEFDVFIQTVDGDVVIDETMTSLANGFIDFWLPRDQTFQVKIEHDGKTVESEISTFKNDNTCITTMQLM